MEINALYKYNFHINNLSCYIWKDNVLFFFGGLQFA